MTTITTTSYAMDILGASIAVAGFASGIFVLGVMCARLAVGKSLDRINLKKWLLIGLLSCFAFNILYFFSHNILALNITRFLHGLGYGLCSSVCGTIVARMIPSFRRGVGIGYYGLSGVFASGIAPFVAVYVVRHNAFDVGSFVSLGIIFSAILCVFAMKVRELKKGAFHIAIPARTIRGKIFTLIEPSALRIAFITLFISICFGALLSFIGAYSKERDLVESGSIFFLIYAITSLFARPIAGKIFDLKGHNAIIVPSLIFYIIALVLVAIAESASVLILSAVCFGLGYGNFVSSAQSYTINTAPKDKMGLATATFYMALDFGAGVGPYLLGFAIGGYGYGIAFGLCAGLIAIALMLYIWLIGAK